MQRIKTHCKTGLYDGMWHQLIFPMLKSSSCSERYSLWVDNICGANAEHDCKEDGPDVGYRRFASRCMGAEHAVRRCWTDMQSIQDRISVWGVVKGRVMVTNRKSQSTAWGVHWNETSSVSQVLDGLSTFRKQIRLTLAVAYGMKAAGTAMKREGMTMRGEG